MALEWDDKDKDKYKDDDNEDKYVLIHLLRRMVKHSKQIITVVFIVKMIRIQTSKGEYPKYPGKRRRRQR